MVDGGSTAGLDTEPMFTLHRVAVRESGAYGVLLHRGQPFAVTLERTYEAPGGLQTVKIPVGKWRCVASRFNRGGYASYEVFVPGHSQIKWHRANVEADLDGCIGVGRSYTGFGIGESRLGFDDFMARAGGAPGFVLEVRQ